MDAKKPVRLTVEQEEPVTNWKIAGWVVAVLLVLAALFVGMFFPG